MTFLTSIIITSAGLMEVLGMWLGPNLHWNTHYVFVTLLGTNK